MFTGNLWILARTIFGTADPAPEPRRIARADALRPGEALVFTYPEEGEDCLLVRTVAGELVAFSQKCTHLSCAVVYDAAHDRLECPCHDGAFAAQSGAVLFGPPPRPLPRLHIEVRDGDVWALGFVDPTEGA